VRRPKAHELVLAIGAFAAVADAGIGCAPLDHPLGKTTPTSSVPSSINVPTAVKVAFYLTLATMLFLVSWLASLRIRNYERGGPDDRRTTKTNVKRRLADFRAGVYMQTLLRDPAAGVMHSFIYFGFLGLFMATGDLGAQPPASRLVQFLHGGTYKAYSAGADFAGVVFLAGILWAAGAPVRAAPVPDPHQDQAGRRHDPRHLRVLAITGFFTEGLRIALIGRPDFEKFSFIGYPLSALVNSWSTGTLRDAHRWLWGVHVVSFVAFLVILPTTKLRHMFTSPMNMYLRDTQRPKGAMKPMPNLMETRSSTPSGLRESRYFTWEADFRDATRGTICGPARRCARRTQPVSRFTRARSC